MRTSNDTCCCRIEDGRMFCCVACPFHGAAGRHDHTCRPLYVYHHVPGAPAGGTTKWKGPRAPTDQRSSTEEPGGRMSKARETGDTTKEVDRGD